MGDMQAFSPAGTQSLSVSTASALLKLAYRGGAVLIANACTDYVFVKFGTDNSVTASNSSTTPDTPIPGGQRMILQLPPAATYVAVITNSGSGTVFVTPGSGAFY